MRIKIALVAVLVLIALGWLSLPKPPLLDGIDFSRRVFDSHGELLRVTLTRDDKFRIRTPIEWLSPEVVKATLRYEDRNYWLHPGVNPFSIIRAAWSLCRGHRRVGASTISMQVARMRFKMQTRTARGKLGQMLMAMRIERHYSKRQILDAYFNLAPYGGNIEGIGAATFFYLAKTPAQITRAEAVALSVIPQNPSRRSPANRDLTRLVAAQRRLDATNADFKLSGDQHRPFLAPHFTTALLRDEARGAADLATTLDSHLQRLVERHVGNYVANQRTRGITNAAVMLVDWRAMEVRAQLGSADFFNAEISGQIDGTRSRRSPGSTLKPFVYALAIDQGLIHPLTTLADSPRSFGEYTPENYDRDFAGPISATDALARSRNVPAVALAARLARPTLYEFLKSAHVSLPHDEKTYGLSLPLGGAEVTMDELVRLYCVLANGGRLRPLKRIANDASDERGERLLSPEAAFLTLEMLGHASRPGVSGTTAEESIFWKTGTSCGFRDAWSIAVFDHYVLAVWVGNFDGSSDPAFVGRTGAAPLGFAMIDGIRALDHCALGSHEPPAGANLRRVDFCAVSGQLPGTDCPHRSSGWFIPGVSPITTCEVHRADVATATNPSKIYEYWPSEMLALFEKAGVPRRRPPSLSADAEVELSSRRGPPPRIISPRAGMVYAMQRNGSATLNLRAGTDADVTTVFWFADKNFLGSTAPADSLPWRALPGSYTVVAVDDHGRSSSSSVKVIGADESTATAIASAKTESFLR